EYKDADTAHRPYIFSSSDHFTLVLPDLTFSEGIQDSGNPSLIFAPVPDGSVHDGRILSFCYGKARSASEIASYLGLSDSTYFRKQVLENLVRNGYLEKNMISRTAYYRTVTDMVSIE
ncbi:MAG: winged helix-turn-helix domain-containing protein, partial [Bullifex sp.]